MPRTAKKKPVEGKPKKVAKGKVKPPSKARLAFGRRLAVARECAGYETATALADKIGMSLARYSRYERGETEPSIETLQRIREATGASLDFLIAGDMTGTPANVSDTAA